MDLGSHLLHSTASGDEWKAPSGSLPPTPRAMKGGAQVWQVGRNQRRTALEQQFSATDLLGHMIHCSGVSPVYCSPLSGIPP